MITKLISPAQKLIAENATTILTSIGVTGTVATGVLSAKAGFRAARKIDAEWERDENVTETPGTRAFNENAKLVWPEFIPAVGTGALTVGAILFSHKMNAGRAATLAAAYSLSENKLKDFRAKVTERFGEDEVAVVDSEPAKSPAMPVFIDGDVTFFDTLTGRYFKSTMHVVQQAELATNREILKHGYASAGFFYSEIEMEDSELLEDLGWDSLYLVNLDFVPAISHEGKLHIVMNHLSKPKSDFSRD